MLQDVSIQETQTPQSRRSNMLNITESKIADTSVLYLLLLSNISYINR